MPNIIFFTQSHSLILSNYIRNGLNTFTYKTNDFLIDYTSIVIMVPGLYLYRAIYNFGIMSLTEAVAWFTSAIMIIIALPLGLISARILTDRTFRYCT